MRFIRDNGPLSLMRSGVSEQSAALARASPSAVPPTPISPALAGAEQANTRKVYGRILRRVAAEFGEDIAPGAASAWGWSAAAARVIASTTRLRPREASPSRR